MKRILADLPDDDVRWLDERASACGQSRAAVLREAVAAFKVHTGGGPKDWIARGAGYWKNRADIGDAVEYQRAMRRERMPYKDI